MKEKKGKMLKEKMKQKETEQKMKFFCLNFGCFKAKRKKIKINNFKK